ncbi:putative MFS-type transporter PB1E7.08c [Grifola frondosa]|uniref:Putative MFS-type transporter PB1E7.08c n=1 Tax=Grifola frondosa TaxID=5627 RepID=A0A1C7MBX1_GRIFR|nr:putative MFS-type transporter PB1E7.08c [Grifola frondosa]
MSNKTSCDAEKNDDYLQDRPAVYVEDPALDLYEEGSIDPVYRAKARVLSCAIQEIGMGKYQWYLFAVTGFGWFADSVWPLLGGLILSPVIAEFEFQGPFLSLALNIGLFVGAVWSFNITLFIAGAFGLAAGGSPNFVTLASLLAILGLGVGGNLPVDSAVFLDFVPGSHQYLLTILSIWWSVGQLVASLIAWPLIANFSCPQGSSTCARADNMGWRYLLFTLGAMTLLLWGIRFFAFPLAESPRFLVGRGRDADAVAVIKRVAAFNGRTCSLTVEHLTSAGEKAGPSQTRAVLSGSSAFSMDHIRCLFQTPKMAWSTSLLIALWGIIGLASTLYNSFLPYLLASRGARFGDSTYYTTYRNQVILGVIGVPGAFLAGWAVEQPYLGRRGTLALFAGNVPMAHRGVLVREHHRAELQRAPRVELRVRILQQREQRIRCVLHTGCMLMGWWDAVRQIMYGVLYALSPEVFPAKDRGTGNGLTATATRVFGILAPVIALYANLATAVPVYVSGALIIGSGLLALLLPYEPRGKTSL